MAISQCVCTQTHILNEVRLPTTDYLSMCVTLYLLTYADTQTEDMLMRSRRTITLVGQIDGALGLAMDQENSGETNDNM